MKGERRPHSGSPWVGPGVAMSPVRRCLQALVTVGGMAAPRCPPAGPVPQLACELAYPGLLGKEERERSGRGRTQTPPSPARWSLRGRPGETWTPNAMYKPTQVPIPRLARKNILRKTRDT